METGSHLGTEKPSQIVSQARKTLGMTQLEFSRLLDTKQSLISKYESGRVDPPARIIIQCVNILKTPSVVGDITLHTIITRLKKDFSDASKSSQRIALHAMMTALGSSS